MTNPSANAEDAGNASSPWVGKAPWRRKWQPTPVFLLGKSHGQRTLMGYSPWSHRVRHTLSAGERTHASWWLRKAQRHLCGTFAESAQRQFYHEETPHEPRPLGGTFLKCQHHERCGQSHMEAWMAPGPKKWHQWENCLNVNKICSESYHINVISYV